MAFHRLCFSIIFSTLFLSAMASLHSPEHCVYTFYVKTGSVIKGGTDSKISVAIGDPSGQTVWIPDLKLWGIMGPTHDYFERDNVDVFSGRGPCIGAPICKMNLTSDGSGAHHGWYCDYVEVTSTGPHKACSQTAFYVDQWLADDAPPFQLEAVIDGCSDWKKTAAARQGRSKRIVVSNPRRSSTASS